MNDGTEEAQAYFDEAEKQLAALDAEMDLLNKVGEKLSDIRPGDVLATATLSPEARGVYHYLLSGMGKGNKEKSARVSALLAARMTDRLVAFHREAGDNDYTAMDALPELLANAEQESQGKEAAQLRQAMKRSPAETLVDFRKEIQKGGVSPAGKAKTFYRFVGSHGTIIDVAYDDMKHAGKHNLTDEQIQAIEENSENFLAVYQETKRKGHYGGIPILAKIKTPVGNAGVVYELLPNGRTLLKTMFFDTDSNIDHWMKKGESSRSLLDGSRSSFTDNRPSIQSIQKELGIVNAGSESLYLSQEEIRTQKEAVRKQYEGTAMWMKAPNGKDTNLTEEQWLLVRTPAFKAWFGDWEYIANAYPSVTAKERIEAKEILKTLRNKDLVSRDENIVARISKEGRSKLVSDAALHKSQKNGFSIEEHYTAVANIKKLFEASVRSQVKEDKNKEITAFESFSAPIMFEKGIAIATLSVKVTKEAKTGRSIYSIELMELKKIGRHNSESGSKTYLGHSRSFYPQYIKDCG